MSITLPAAGGRAVPSLPQPNTISEGRAYRAQLTDAENINHFLEDGISLTHRCLERDNQAGDMNRETGTVVLSELDENYVSSDVAIHSQPPAQNSLMPTVLSMEVSQKEPSEYGTHWTFSRQADGEHLKKESLAGKSLEHTEEAVLSPDGKTLTWSFT